MADELPRQGDSRGTRFRQEHIAHWDEVARRSTAGSLFGRAYHKRIDRYYRFLVPPGQKVLEVGCGRGGLLASLSPSDGLGVDFSPAMIEVARRQHPEFRFEVMDAHDLGDLDETFDVIILSDLVNDVWGVQQVLEQVSSLCAARTRVILNSYSRLWELPLRLMRRLGFATRVLQQNWLTVHDITNMLALADMEVVTRSDEVVFPFPVPILSGLANRWLAKIWPFSMGTLTHFIVARPRPDPEPEKPLVSVIVAARNEEGNVESIFERVPEMGRGTELVFVEGGSTDDTYGAIERAMARHPERRCRLLRQEGKGKGDAVRLGFAEAAGDVLMILDADLTVPPEDLPRFCDALIGGKGDFINGVRLVYPMEERAMRFFNLLGNKAFSVAFSWMLGRPIKDTLCGTKVLRKTDYERIAANRSYFGDFDPFGDFDLIFGAAKLNMKIVDLPVRYRERVYGETNIHRWRHGLILLRMVLVAARRIKFV